MTALPLPAPVGFPAPARFPASPSLADPYFGLNPFGPNTQQGFPGRTITAAPTPNILEARVASLVGGATGVPTLGYPGFTQDLSSALVTDPATEQAAAR